MFGGRNRRTIDVKDDIIPTYKFHVLFLYIVCDRGEFGALKKICKYGLREDKDISLSYLHMWHCKDSIQKTNGSIYLYTLLLKVMVLPSQVTDLVGTRDNAACQCNVSTKRFALCDFLLYKNNQDMSLVISSCQPFT